MLCMYMFINLINNAMYFITFGALHYYCCKIYLNLRPPHCQRTNGSKLIVLKICCL